MMLYEKEVIVVDMPTTGRTHVLQQPGKIAAGTFVPQNGWTVTDENVRSSNDKDNHCGTKTD